jgi:hypothetical protein
MSTETELLELERLGWEALSASGGPSPAAHFGGVLADDAVFLLPGGLVLQGRDAILESMEVPPWTSYVLDHQQVVLLSAHAAAVVYRGSAVRAESPYRALFSSTYRGSGQDWSLVVHQQTA